MAALRILVADDHDLMRRGIKTIIESRKGWEICGEALTGTQAVAKAQGAEAGRGDSGHFDAGAERHRSGQENPQVFGEN